MSPGQSAAVFVELLCASRQQLQSASRHQLLLIPRYRLRTLSRRAFAVPDPTFCNSLADELRLTLVIGLN